MAETTSLQQVAIGFDQAKKAVYDIMKRYFPLVGDSKSTLVNALVSGLALLYSMYQVFAKLLQDELYVTTAKELESLYKLIPLVGIDLPQPIPMSLSLTAAPQDTSVTTDTDSMVYPEHSDPVVDGSGNKFYQRIFQFVQQIAFTFNLTTIAGGRLYTWVNPGYTSNLEFSLGRLLGDKFVPISVLAGDSLQIDFPYKNLAAGVIRRARLKSDGLILDRAFVWFIDNGSDVPTDLGTSCLYYPETGNIRLSLKTDSNITFDDADLGGQPINLTYTVRSSYRKNVSISGVDVSFHNPISAGWASASYIFDNKTTIFTFTSSVSGMLGVAQPSYKDISPYGRWPSRIDPYSVKLSHVDGDVSFDFTTALRMVDDRWGVVYRASTTWLGTTYYAYVLDEYSGLIVWEDPKQVDPAKFTFDVTMVGPNRLLVDQYTVETKNVNPPVELNFDNLTFVLEATDPVMFHELVLKITDSAYATLLFEEVYSLSAVQGNALKTYFEVMPLSPTKIQIRLANSVDWSTIENLQIIYKTVKSLSSYKSGEGMTGNVKLRWFDGTYLVAAGRDLFAVDARNIYAGSGPVGVPTTEQLRDLLAKAAYTLNQNVSKINYEAAIQTFYLVQGFDARIKVFGYEDFGTLFFDSVNGNIVFFIGVVNRVANSDFVLVVSKGWDSTAQLTMLELDANVPGSLTDFSQTSIVPVGSDALDVDAIQKSLRDNSVMTSVPLSEGLSTRAFVRMYAIYFALKLRPAQGFSLAEATLAVKTALANYFRWSTFAFVKDINVSDTYRILDSLAEVDKLLFTNFSHYRNDGNDGALRVGDVAYKTIYTKVDYAKTHMVVRVENETGLPFQGFSAGVSEPEILTWAGGTGVFTSYAILSPTYGSWRLLSFYLLSGNFPAAEDTVTGASSGATADLMSGTYMDWAHGTSVGRPVSVSVADGKNRFKPTADTGAISVTADAASHKLIAASGVWHNANFYVGMKVNVSGFTYVANNVIGATVLAVTEYDLVLDSVLVDEGPVASVRVVEAIRFSSFIQAGRRISTRGFYDAASSYPDNLTSKLVSLVAADFVEMDADETPVMVAGSAYAMDMDSLLERMDNPLWDFSSAAQDRLIKVDVLGIGGIDVEEY